MRLATYNVEWFSNLFARDGKLLEDGEWSGRQDVTRGEQAAALGRVFEAIDADAIMVIEAPDAHGKRDGAAALEAFAARFSLRARRAILGFVNQTQQEIALLYDPDRISAKHDPRGEVIGRKGDIEAPRFDSVFRIDLDIDATEDQVRWSKPPLEVDLTYLPSGDRMRLIGVHAKSKAPHGARNERDMMRISIANRRKQLAQCIWLRSRIDAHLDAGEPLIVLGDFNDGPGLDEYEKLFGRSSIEIVMGEDGQRQLFDPHARQAVTRRVGASPTSARFRIPPDGRFLQALLDYIFLSPDLMSKRPAWRIWHPFEDPACLDDSDLQSALLTASDHFPVTLDLAL